MNVTGYTHDIKTRILSWGADLVGVADVAPLSALKLNPPDLLDGFARAVSIAIQLPAAIFEAISDRPTPVYAATYQTANRMLDELAFRTSVTLQKEGFHSLPVPASQVLDKENWYGAITHKAVAPDGRIGLAGEKSSPHNPSIRIESPAGHGFNGSAADGGYASKEPVWKLYVMSRCLSRRCDQRPKYAGPLQGQE